MFDAIPVLEVIGVDEKNDRVIRTLGYVEQLRDGTLKATVHCDAVSDNKRVYSASVCADCTAYPTTKLETLLGELLDTVSKHVAFMLWYSAVCDGTPDAPNMRYAITGALRKYGIDA